jgi:glycerol uptake facilitator-like aquaporin
MARALDQKLSTFCDKLSRFDAKVSAILPPLPPLAVKCVSELIGTALLSFTIAVAAGLGAPLAGVGIGCTLMTAIYAGGHLSGAHYNPAVTLAILVRGKIAPKEVHGSSAHTAPNRSSLSPCSRIP